MFKAHKTTLKVGAKAPEFEGFTQKGKLIKSSDLLGKTFVLFFYPKDFTPGCTNEVCSLRDGFSELKKKKVKVIGVSADDEKSHKKFVEKFNLPFDLIADLDKKIIKAFKVWGKKQLAGRIYTGIVRTTFIIDENGLIKHIIHKVDNENAADQILEFLSSEKAKN